MLSNWYQFKQFFYETWLSRENCFWGMKRPSLQCVLCFSDNDNDQEITVETSSGVTPYAWWLSSDNSLNLFQKIVPLRPLRSCAIFFPHLMMVYQIHLFENDDLALHAERIAWYPGERRCTSQPQNTSGHPQPPQASLLHLPFPLR